MRRDESRLLVVPPGPARLQHHRFRDVVDLFESGDVLVVNESKVLPVRLLGRKPTGAPAEILLVRPGREMNDPYVWEALVRPGGKLKPGRTVVIADDLAVEIVDSAPGGGRLVRLRDDEPLDRERYQTVYAREAGSVAAPTAGLHFTDELLSALDAKGISWAAITLHIGVGTFRPVEADDPALHDMHHERYVVSDAAARSINSARVAGGRVWAVGTTTVRTLESVASADGVVSAGSGSTELFIRPPYAFKVVDCLLTNFHLPRSTLLMLVAALGGYERTMAAYAEAIQGPYRFYSYGDAMAVVRRP